MVVKEGIDRRKKSRRERERKRWVGCEGKET